MKRILVTGGGGYIGSVATYLLLRNNYDVVVIDNFSTGYEKPLKWLKVKFGAKLTYYNADLNIPQSIREVLEKEKNIDAVLHYAAVCLVNESMENPQKYFQNNVNGTHNLLTELIKFKIRNIVFSSTCAVYGEAKYVPVDEKHQTEPANPYGLTKRMIEQMIEWYGKLGMLNFVILRYFNVCGASDDGMIGDSKNPSVLLVQNAVRGALNIAPFFLTCPEVDTSDKTPIRDYINVVDLNNAHIKALKLLLEQDENKPPIGEIINLGTGTGNSVLEIIKSVEEKTGYRFNLKRGEPRKGEYAKMIADITKAKKLLNWEPQHTINDSIESLIKWYKKHPGGWN